MKDWRKRQLDSKWRTFASSRIGRELDATLNKAWRRIEAEAKKDEAGANQKAAQTITVTEGGTSYRLDGDHVVIAMSMPLQVALDLADAWTEYVGTDEPDECVRTSLDNAVHLMVNAYWALIVDPE